MVLQIPLAATWFKARAEGNQPKTYLSDSVDRLHCGLTVVILLMFTVLLQCHYFGKPIDCHTPHQVDKAKWTPYVEQYCFVQGTYRYKPGPNEMEQPFELGDYVGYYQWVPVFFFFQLLCFMLPYFVWEVVQNCLYIDMRTVVSHSAALSQDVNKRGQKTQRLATYVFNYFHYRHLSNSRWLSGFWRRRNVVSSFYLVLKLLNLCNCVVQFYLVCRLLGADPFWGVREAFSLLGGMGTHVNWPNATISYFPKEVRCSYAMAVQDVSGGVILNHSPTQCLLTINYINERLFVFLYFWYLTLATITAMNIVFHVIDWISHTSQKKVIACIIQNEACSVTRLRLQPHAEKFTETFLGPEGVLLLKFVYRNTGAIVAHDLTIKIWEMFRQRKGLAMGGDTLSNGSEYTEPKKTASGDGYDTLPNA